MEPIGSIGGTGGRITPIQLPSNQQASAAGVLSGAGSSSTAASTTLTMQSSMTNITQVSGRVDSMLNDLGIDPETNNLLRMMIGLMILQMMLGQSGEAAQGNGSEFSMLNQLSQRSESSRSLTIQASTMTYRSEIYSAELGGSRAVESSGNSSPDGGSGGQLDLSI